MSTELHEAIVQHDLKRVRRLLSQGADPNALNQDGFRPLHLAAGELGVGGSIDFVILLLEHDADVNAWDAKHNETSIITVSSSPEPDAKDVEAARLLLQAGADPNVRDSEGETPLRLAVEHGSLELTALLLRHGAGKMINTWGGLNGLTVLGIAARQFNVPMIELLLKQGADPEAIDEYDETACAKLPPRETCDPHTWDQVIELLGRCKSR